jgi:protein-tyrosine phosphatase
VARVVLFLCTGNFYRSRFAEHLFNEGARQRGLDWRAESAGLALHCRTLNEGAIASVVVQALLSRNVVLAEPPRPPRDATESMVLEAERVVLLSEREHRDLFLARFASCTATVVGWDIDDIDRCPAEHAFVLIEIRVEALLDELTR